MDNRRLILAVFLSFTMILGWTYFSQFMGWSPSPEEVQRQQQQQKAAEQAKGQAPQAQPGEAAAPQSPAPDAAEAPAFVPTPGQDITVSTPLFTAVFNSSGGILKSFGLAQYTETDPDTLLPSEKPVQLISPEAAQQAPLGLVLNNRPTWISGQGAASWRYEGEADIKLESGSRELTFTGQLGDITITRVITIQAGSYVMADKITLSGATPQLVDYATLLATGPLATATEYMKESYAVRQQGGSFDKESNIKDLTQGLNLGSNVDWAGTMGTYFLAAVIPADKSMNLKNQHQNGVYRIILEKDKVQLGGGQDVEIQNSYYFGPKRVADLEAAPGGIISAMDYGWYGWVAAPLLIMLKWFYGLVGSWGVAIILMTVVIKIVLWPLSYKSYKSMDQMRKVQPLMQKIREKYKDDKQRQNQEVMQLYKTYKVNPAGGCLPILIQLPIFIGLYRALLYSIELRQTSFIPTLPFTDIVWLADLSLKDPLYITPIVMGLTMFIQQKLTPTTGDPTQAKVMMFMPVIFTVLFVNFPSGLVLYWLVNNVLSIFQQYWQLRLRKSS